VLALPWLVREPRLHVDAIRPPSELLAFYAELEARGNRGPILEVPMGFGLGALEASTRILANAWHRRRTSSCYASYALPGHEKLGALVARLPDPASIRELAALGFTTIVVHQPTRGAGTRWTERLEPLRLLHATEAASAYALEVPQSASAPP
jgi:hypothetical protein